MEAFCSVLTPFSLLLAKVTIRCVRPRCGLATPQGRDEARGLQLAIKLDNCLSSCILNKCVSFQASALHIKHRVTWTNVMLVKRLALSVVLFVAECPAQSAYWEQCIGAKLSGF